MLEAIIFDWGGIFTKPGTFKEFINHCSEKYNIPEEKIRETHRKYWFKCKTKLNDDEYWNNLSSTLKITSEELKKEIFSFFYLDPEVLKFAKSLKNKFKIAIITNNLKAWFEKQRKQYNLDNIFEIIITSYETGLRKPEKEIYLLTLNKLNLKPEQCLFIDDQERNLKPAQELGMIILKYTELKELKSLFNQYG